MQRRFGSKDKLVDSLVKQLDSDDEDDGALKQRLLASSNKKLLRLADIVDEVSNTYGGKDKLIATLSEAHGKGKDGDYVSKLATYTHAQLLDMIRVANRRGNSRK
jgi:hypothetical protein